MLAFIPNFDKIRLKGYLRKSKFPEKKRKREKERDRKKERKRGEREKGEGYLGNESERERIKRRFLLNSS